MSCDFSILALCGRAAYRRFIIPALCGRAAYRRTAPFTDSGRALLFPHAEFCEYFADDALVGSFAADLAQRFPRRLQMHAEQVERHLPRQPLRRAQLFACAGEGRKMALFYQKFAVCTVLCQT